MLSDVLVIYVQFVCNLQLIVTCCSQLCITCPIGGHLKVKNCLL
jgi:hypothetical protein